MNFASRSKQIVQTTTTLASSPPQKTQLSSPVIADTGATGRFLTSTVPYDHKRPANPGIAVLLPDRSKLNSTHTARLKLLMLPPTACEAHIFPNLASGSLISIGQLCGHGCTTHFDAATVTIRFRSQTILTGRQSPISRLWTLDLPDTTTTPLPTPSMNALVHNPNLAERIAFYHAAMFSPAISTWCDAIDAGHMTS
jgi:hypothetical protein